MARCSSVPGSMARPTSSSSSSPRGHSSSSPPRSRRWPGPRSPMAQAGSTSRLTAEGPDAANPTLIRPSQSIGIGTSGIATTEYLRIFLLLAALATLLLAIVAEATEDRGDAPAVALGILATCGLALSLPDARAAVLAATAAGAFGALVTLVPDRGRTGATVGTRVLRATAVSGTMAIAATAWIGRDLSELAA